MVQIQTVARLLALALLLSPASLLQAASPSEALLPANTKGFVSLADGEQALKKWDQTQLGSLLKDPLMQPFVEHVQAQLQDGVLNLGDRLGVQWGQFRELRGGEVSLAMLQPGAVKSNHAVALVVNAEGRQERAAEMLDQIVSTLISRGAVRSAKLARTGTEMIVMTLPKANQSGRAFYALDKDMLLGCDHQEMLEQMLERLHGRRNDSLAQTAAFRSAMKTSAAVNADVRWFVEPFGFAETVNASLPAERRRKMDLVSQLSRQGFRGIQGLGGAVRLATARHDIEHRTLIYAPGEAGKVGTARQRLTLAARMLEFPNAAKHAPLDWAPVEASSYLTFRWDMRSAFEYSKSLVNEVLGEDVFDELLRNIAEDPDGPQIDLRKDVVAHLGQRVDVMTRVKQPITPKSEKVVVFVELTNAEAMRQTLNQAMRADTSAKPHLVGRTIVWQMGAIKPQRQVEAIPGVVISGPRGRRQQLAPAEATNDDADSLIPKVSLAVVGGRLLVGNDVDYLKQVIAQGKVARPLAAGPDYAAVAASLKSLGAGHDSFRFFVRTVDAYRPTYELLRQGRMPESETLAGQLLNKLLGGQEGDGKRRQQLDGSKMPRYDAVARYLAPAGLYVRTLDSGWLISGCLLNGASR